MAVNRYRPIHRSRTAPTGVDSRRVYNHGITQQAVLVVEYAEVLDKISLKCIRYDKDSREINCIEPDDLRAGKEEFGINSFSDQHHLGVVLSMPVQLPKQDLSIIIQNFGADFFRLVSTKSRLDGNKLYIVYKETEDSPEKFDEFLVLVEQFIARVVVSLKCSDKFEGINACFVRSSLKDFLAQYESLDGINEMSDELAALLVSKN